MTKRHWLFPANGNENEQQRPETQVRFETQRFRNLGSEVLALCYVPDVVATAPANVSDGYYLCEPNRQLWRADISLATDRRDEKSKGELMRMIEQIRSVRFMPRKHVPEFVVVPVKASAVEPNEAVPDTIVESKAEQDQPDPGLPYESITEGTLQVLRDLSGDPEEVNYPFELAETLFLSGNVIEAAVFYAEALRRTEPNDISSSRDRAWVLFQAGNCLRNTDLPAATKMYTQLLEEYPYSPWADMAKAQARLIDWYLKDEPHKLVVDAEPAGEK